MLLRNRVVSAFLGIGLALTGCQSAQQREAERRREVEDRNSPAYKAGEAAHKIAREAENAASAAGRKLQESARKAREGWKEQSSKEREREREKEREDRNR